MLIWGPNTDPPRLGVWGVNRSLGGAARGGCGWAAAAGAGRLGTPRSRDAAARNSAGVSPAACAPLPEGGSCRDRAHPSLNARICRESTRLEQGTPPPRAACLPACLPSTLFLRLLFSLFYLPPPCPRAACHVPRTLCCSSLPPPPPPQRMSRLVARHGRSRRRRR